MVALAIQPQGPRPPRRWQTEALDALRRWWKAPPSAGVVRAVMGSGKSWVIGKVAAGAGSAAGSNERVVVTTPTIRLVQELTRAIEEFAGAGACSPYYTFGKALERRIIVCCMDSFEELADKLQRFELRCPIWIADECHRTEAQSCKVAAQTLAPIRRLGFTATPWLSDERRSLTLWDALLYDYGPSQAVADGAVVPIEVHHWEGAEAPIDDVCIAMTKDAVAHGAIIVNADSIDDCERFARLLQDAGIRAAAIHSRIAENDQDRRIADLRTGKLQALVHVNMLQEGVDFPWLAGIVLRRAVSSRVRFAQEVGRVLRSHPGKTVAHVYDPNDLFGALSIDYEAVLSGGAVERKKRGPGSGDLPDSWGLPDDDPANIQRDFIKVAPLPELVRALRRWTLHAAMLGLAEVRGQNARWRREEATSKQVDAIKRMSWAAKAKGFGVPAPVRDTLRRLSSGEAALSKGDASDLLTLLHVVASSRSWLAAGDAS